MLRKFSLTIKLKQQNRVVTDISIFKIKEFSMHCLHFFEDEDEVFKADPNYIIREKIFRNKKVLDKMFI